MSSSARQNILSFCTACLLPHTKEKLARVGSVWITAKLGNHRLPLNVVTLYFVGWAIPAARRPPDAHGRLAAPEPRLATKAVATGKSTTRPNVSGSSPVTPAMTRRSSCPAANSARDPRQASHADHRRALPEHHPHYVAGTGPRRHTHPDLRDAGS